ncbi:MAG TPA: dihydroorotase [Gammaproteobacteria bacterium]|mgnify:FL=1|jgi:dihydroorotase|nr:dihydroorotase [Gammaproteobacteria bacterium]HIA89397.1 dihydroorotase [Gammaproteobacteria bacterium]HIN59274.1 dihydroorotase [Gammaproteobacteria bacterium]
MYDLIVRNASIACNDGSTMAGDVGCRDGRIQEISASINSQSSESVDGNGHLLLPGVIDPQVHFREPGATHKEDLGSGARAAVRGGVTSFLEMPNCNPPTIDQTQMDWKLKRASETCVANFGFFVGATKSNLESLNNVHPACGIKIFMGSSTGSLLVDDDTSLDKIFSHGQRLIAVHAEDEYRIKQRTSTLLSDNNTTYDYSIHSQVRDSETACIATRRALELSERYGRRLHILHLSTGEEVELLRQNKPSQVTCEVIPNHLFLSTEDYKTQGARVVMNPPIREPANADQLWQGLHDGVIDIIATDHAPHTLAEKSVNYPATPSGMPGVETSLPLMLTAMTEGRCTLADILNWMCRGPAQLYGIPNKGQIAEGFDADLTLVDMQTARLLQDEDVVSRAGWSAYRGRRLTGWPLVTVVGGRVVYADGAIRPGIFGQPLTFDSTQTL